MGKAVREGSTSRILGPWGSRIRGARSQVQGSVSWGLWDPDRLSDRVRPLVSVVDSGWTVAAVPPTSSLGIHHFVECMNQPFRPTGLSSTLAEV